MSKLLMSCGSSKAKLTVLNTNAIYKSWTKFFPKQQKYGTIPRTKPSAKVRQKCEELQIDKGEQSRKIMTLLEDEIKQGLGKKTHANAIIKCFVTYVQNLPDGSEKGKFLALDLGGTFLRVLLIDIKAKNRIKIKGQTFPIPDEIKLGPGEHLFRHIANNMAVFMKEEQVLKKNLPMGITFSYPLIQKGIKKGILQRWTKGFKCSGVVGKDVVQLLEEAIKEQGSMKLKTAAILNDTTGTLMTGALHHRTCRIGLIIATGYNVCYVEKQKNAELFDDVNHGSGNVIINTEMGAFGDNGRLDFLRTGYDRAVDKDTVNAGSQIYEKMISGMYMGEIARLVLTKLTKKGLLFKGQGSQSLFQRHQFFSKYISQIESDAPGTFTNCKRILDILHIKNPTTQDFTDVRYVCECISRRSAHLISCAMATYINRINEPHVTIGVHGSVYQFHPHLHNLLVERIGKLVKPGLKFDVKLAPDGSGLGAAITAAVQVRTKR